MIVLDGTLGLKSLIVEERPTLTLPVLRTSLYIALLNIKSISRTLHSLKIHLRYLKRQITTLHYAKCH